MSEERAQISMSNTKKEMLEAYQALLAEVQTKSLENPKEEQKRIEQKRWSLRLRLSPLRRWTSLLGRSWVVLSALSLSSSLS